MPDNNIPSDTTDYRTSSPAVSKRFDFDETAPSEGVVRAVSAVADTGPTATDSLYESVDPEALDELLRTSGQEIEVTVQYLGYEVLLTGDGTVSVYPDYR